MIDLENCHCNIKKWWNQPEYIIDVVTFLDEAWAELPEAYIMEIERMISEEIQNEVEITKDFREYHPLWWLLVCNQLIADPNDERDLFAKSKYFPGHAHVGFQLW